MIRLGRFTVVTRLRFDNPAFAQYLVFIGDKLIGKSFSMPDEGTCRWLECQEIAGRTVYAEKSAPLQRHTMGDPIRRTSGHSQRARTVKAFDSHALAIRALEEST